MRCSTNSFEVYLTLPIPTPPPPSPGLVLPTRHCLDRRDGNEFAGEGWTLKTEGGLQLMHKEKVVARNCRKETWQARGRSCR
jgi:hypothetical protein